MSKFVIMCALMAASTMPSMANAEQESPIKCTLRQSDISTSIQSGMRDHLPANLIYNKNNLLYQ